MKEPLEDLQKLRDKKLIVFDIDGTLTPSKAPADKEMIQLLHDLLDVKSVAIIGGGKYSLFREQLTDQMPEDKNLEKLYLFPTNSTAFYRFDGTWNEVYSHKLTKEEKDKILNAFETTFREANYEHSKKIYGPEIEDRDTQISFSPLGQEIVAMLGEKEGVVQKEEWNKKYDPIRQKMRDMLEKLLPEFEVRAGGLTTIDITRKGIDKAYGVRQIAEHLGIPIDEMLFVGDAIYPGGNDYAALNSGIDYVKVTNPSDTKELIKKLVS